MKLLSLLRCLWPPFSGITSLVTPPSIPGVEYELLEERTHFMLPEDLACYELVENRTHFTAPEDD